MQRYTVRYYAKDAGDVARFGSEPLVEWVGSAESYADALVKSEREVPVLTHPDTGAEIWLHRTVGLTL